VWRGSRCSLPGSRTDPRPESVTSGSEPAIIHRNSTSAARGRLLLGYRGLKGAKGGLKGAKGGKAKASASYGTPPEYCCGIDYRQSPPRCRLEPTGHYTDPAVASAITNLRQRRSVARLCPDCWFGLDSAALSGHTRAADTAGLERFRSRRRRRGRRCARVLESFQTSSLGSPGGLVESAGNRPEAVLSGRKGLRGRSG